MKWVLPDLLNHKLEKVKSSNKSKNSRKLHEQVTHPPTVAVTASRPLSQPTSIASWETMSSWQRKKKCRLSCRWVCMTWPQVNSCCFTSSLRNKSQRQGWWENSPIGRVSISVVHLVQKERWPRVQNHTNLQSVVTWIGRWLSTCKNKIRRLVTRSGCLPLPLCLHPLPLYNSGLPAPWHFLLF